MPVSQPSEAVRVMRLLAQPNSGLARPWHMIFLVGYDAQGVRPDRHSFDTYGCGLPGDGRELAFNRADLIHGWIRSRIPPILMGGQLPGVIDGHWAADSVFNLRVKSEILLQTDWPARADPWWQEQRRARR